MTIVVRVKTNARKNEVANLGENKLLVSVSAAPVDGKANERVIELLADYFHVPKRSVVILRGLSSKDKIIEVG